MATKYLIPNVTPEKVVDQFETNAQWVFPWIKLSRKGTSKEQSIRNELLPYSLNGVWSVRLIECFLSFSVQADKQSAGNAVTIATRLRIEIVNPEGYSVCKDNYNTT